jgi:chemotaxis-related protein WspD
MTFCWREIGILGTRTCPRLAEAIHCVNCPEYSRLGRELFDRAASADAQAEWAAELALTADRTEATTLSVVIFRIGQEWFALRTALFADVAEMHPPHTVPFRSGSGFLGLVNINGELLPCISMAALLGLPESGGPGAVRPRMCVIAHHHERVAFPVDEALGVRRMDSAAFSSPPSTVSKTPAALTASVFICEGRDVALLDEAKLFAAVTRHLTW